MKIDNRVVELMGVGKVEKFTSLAVILADAAVLVTRDDILAEVAPACDGGLAFVADNCEGPLICLLSVDVRVDFENDDVGEVTHALLGNAQELGAVLVELNALDSGRELPCLETATGLDLPEADGVVGRAGGDHGGGGVDIDSPDSTNVAMVGAETLAVVRVPYANLLILGDREDEIAIEVVAAGRNVS